MAKLMPALNDAHHAALTAMWFVDELFQHDPGVSQDTMRGVMAALTDILIATAPPELGIVYRRTLPPARPTMTGHEVPLDFGGEGGR